MAVHQVIRMLSEVETLRWKLLLSDRARIDAEIRATGLEFGGTVNDAIAPHGNGYAILRAVPPQGPVDAPDPGPAALDQGTRPETA
jgi:hypothetical protein